MKGDYIQSYFWISMLIVLPSHSLSHSRIVTDRVPSRFVRSVVTVRYTTAITASEHWFFM